MLKSIKQVWCWLKSLTIAPPEKLIFISYRRTDSQYVAGMITRELEKEFGPRVFHDNTSIPPGVHFPEYIRTAVRTAKVLLLLIGKEWLTCIGEDGQLRLNNPDDIHRNEIELAQDVARIRQASGNEKALQIIPVVLEGGILKAGDTRLPDSLRFLGELQSLRLRPASSDYTNDLQKLKDQIRLSGIPPRWQHRLWKGRLFHVTLGVFLFAGILITTAIQGKMLKLRPLENREFDTRFIQLSADDRLRIEGATATTIVWIAKTCDSEQMQALAEKYENDPETLLRLSRKLLTP